MSFLGQPTELIIQQLLLLSADDLLNFCKTNPEIRRVCADPLLWRMKLQNEFPQADFRVPDPKKEYLRLVNQKALDELFRILDQVDWFTLNSSPQEAIVSLTQLFREENAEEDLKRLEDSVRLSQQPIPGLHDLTIYYPVDYWTDYLHPVRYGINEPITPLQVLESIYLFYQQPYTQENADAIARLIQITPTRVDPGDKILDTLGDHVFFEGFLPHENGYMIRLGS